MMAQLYRTAYALLGVMALSLIPLSLAACGQGSVNGPVRVAAGTTQENAVQTVNGPVTVGEGARVEGGARSVNGSVEIASGASVEKIQNVNGAITVGPKARVTEEIQTVNGTVEMDSEAAVGGDIQSVNGAVRLTGATVEGTVTVVTADVTLRRRAVVRRDIVIDQEDANEPHPVVITLQGGSVVEGDIRVKGDADVTVRIEGDSRVEGTISGAEVVRP